MLVPPGLSKSERKEYEKKNAFRLAKRPVRPKANKHPGLRPVKEKASASTTRQEGPKAPTQRERKK